MPHYGIYPYDITKNKVVHFFDGKVNITLLYAFFAQIRAFHVDQSQYNGLSWPYWHVLRHRERVHGDET